MIEDYFSTPIYVEKLDTLLISRELDFAVQNSVFRNDWQPDNDTASTTFSPDSSTNIVFEQNLINFNNVVLHHAHNFLNQAGQQHVAGEICINSSWLNIVEHEQVIGFHEHGYQPNMFSGCYYHKVPQGSGDIQFKSPNPFAVSFPHQTSKYTNVINIEVGEGMLLFFPSWLMHKVLPNKSNDPRITLAFNVEFKYTYME